MLSSLILKFDENFPISLNIDLHQAIFKNRIVFFIKPI